MPNNRLPPLSQLPADNPSPLLSPGIATSRAISYAICSAARHLPKAEQDALFDLATWVSVIVAPPVLDTEDRAECWRMIAAAALQMEMRVMGIDHTLPATDKPLTTD